jgi:tRNA pseudouridine55 synthase
MMEAKKSKFFPILYSKEDSQSNIGDDREIYQDAIILADKPKEWSSNGVLNVLRKKLHIKKAGHSGTLDPMATGLLVICTGKMTKKITDFIDYDKEYEGMIKIGAKTESFDTEKEEYDEMDTSSVSDEDIYNVRLKFMGEMLQIPPMHSAIKHQGKPLYQLARKGKEIVREPRKIVVSEFELKRLNQNELAFRISCSKGTYIRSIANDIGAELGVGGYLKELRRIRIGKFVLGDLDREINGIKYRILDAEC